MDDELRALWAANILGARRRAGLSQAAAGDRCGVDQTTFSRWERGKLIPTEGHKARIASEFGLEAREMFPLVMPVAVG